MNLDLSMWPLWRASANRCKNSPELGPIPASEKFSKIFNDSNTTAAPPAGGGWASTLYPL